MKTLIAGMISMALVIGAWAVHNTMAAMNQAAQVMQLAQR